MSASSERSEFAISSSTGSYTVMIQTGLVSGSAGHEPGISASGSVIADRYFHDHDLAALREAHPIWIEATEREKSLERTPGVIEQMRASGANRSTPLVAVGGGVIQDIAAFVASVYMRGLSWSYAPTTVLAMVDSCIGGKSSINVGPYKNLVGTFHPPQHIYIDPGLAQTLPRDQFASGLIEAAKICFCRGEADFQAYLACGPTVDMPADRLERLIRTSLLAKKYFIEIDEFDKKERLLLNFGHTFGHAIEGASNYGIPHGIAVGVGILCSLAFQRARGIDFSAVTRVALFEEHLNSLVSTMPGLREQLASLDLAEVLERFASDKKHSAANYTLILVDGQGEVQLERIPRTSDAEVRHAIETTLESYSL